MLSPTCSRCAALSRVMSNESQSEVQPLSEREREILSLVAQGLSNQQIAHRLGISVNTVKVHLRNIFGKIGAASRTEASMYAVRAGIVTLEGAPLPEPAARIDDPPLPAPDTSTPAINAQPTPIVNTNGVEAQAIAQPASPARATELAPSLAAPPPADLSPATAPPAPIVARTRPTFRVLLAGLVALLILSIAGLAWWSQPTSKPTTNQQPSATLPARWQRLTDMPEPRAAFAIATFEDRIYVVGGENEQGVLASLIRFDVASGTWTRLSAKPTAVTDVRAIVLSGKLYVPGGRRSANPADVTDHFERYDLRAEQWESLPALPEARSGYALVALDGKIYLIGGWDGTRYRNDVFEYDPEREMWHVRSAMPTARGFAAAGIVEDRIFIMGGENEQGALANNEVYTPALEATSPWSRRAPLPQPRTRAGAAVVLSSLIIIGGHPDGAPVKYNVSTDNWETLEPPPTPIGAQPGVVLHNGKIYSLGGQLQANPYSSLIQTYQAIYSQFLPR